MSSYMCPICTRTFSSRIGYSQHMNKCILTADDDNNSQMLKLFSNSWSFSKDFQNYRSSNNDNNSANLFSSRSENKSKKISISSIKFGYKSTENISKSATKKKNLYDISKNFEAEDDMSFELEDENNMSFEIADNNEEFIEILCKIIKINGRIIKI